MTEVTEAWVQLATRIPRRLHREMKLHCVANEVSLMAFVVDALREKLQAGEGATHARRGRQAS
jgi:predicted HicB family RNase H-like nuclease